ncbi:uncharacterized protein LACBIDRAFT_303316 [Laccaria bicolor S238N-H82]|uniref:Predicted protein n=1 Tax=Laccaria bicolor (strain S238N-H82 / ATCC MYA-4686) TaxID=486041 RepID=B0DJB5_LACBS|nr:uncharacterized protein LACBIDRAFT_303316 [Laccaria bicolor S238N-H82]EDR05374.1 predicted protein [Laccaria bicolor S238N-H82]|eukprot:XP_001883932.1 predicted protein [Laccaria bicolor S238N-H82]
MGIFQVTLGPLLLGIFCQRLSLWGTYIPICIVLQYCIQRRVMDSVGVRFNDAVAFKTDTINMAGRLTVFALLCLDTFHSSSLIYLAWVYAVDGYNNPFALTRPVWPYPAWVFVATVTACITQVFLAYRILRLKKGIALYATVLVLAAAAFIFGIIFGVKVCNVKTYASHRFTTTESCLRS